MTAPTIDLFLTRIDLRTHSQHLFHQAGPTFAKARSTGNWVIYVEQCSVALQAELKHMQRLVAAGQCPIEDLDLVGDDLMKWRFKIRVFDDTTQGGTNWQCGGRQDPQHGHDVIPPKAGSIGSGYGLCKDWWAVFAELPQNCIESNALTWLTQRPTDGTETIVMTAGGKDLNADLRQLKQKHGQDCILLEIGFPVDYPTRPFSLRIVSPRCKCEPFP